MKKERKDALKDKSFWANLWKILEPSHKQMKILGVLIVVFECARLIGPYILKLIIDRLVNFSGDIMPIIYLILIMFASEQFNSVLHYFKDKMIFDLLIVIEYYLPIKAQEKLVYLDLDYHERENTGNKITKIDHGIMKITNLLGDISWEVLPTVSQLIVTLIVLLFIDWRFAISFIIFAPLFIYLTYKVNRDLRPVRTKRQKNYEIASGKMAQSIININTVKSFVQEKREVKEFRFIRNIIKINELKEWFTILNSALARNLIIDLGRISILLFGTYLVWQSKASVGTLVFVITLTEKSYFSLFRLSRFYDRVEEGAIAVGRLMDLMHEKSTISNPENGFVTKEIEGEIELKSVSFTYKNSRRMALDHLNLKINSGCVTALVGTSGGGKTTLARIIYRHYDPTKGEVFLDGKKLKDYDLYALRKKIAIVPQEVEIFDLSIKDNIAYSNPKASFEEIRAAAKIANADEFISRLEKKYDTLTGERGVRLSGGQRQRIGIARAVLSNPKILIFDEATSNLDSKSEKLIQAAMEKIIKNRTVIIIAHRLSTIKRADKIVVLENGKIIEEGNHIELANKVGGLYSELLKLQRMGDVE